MAESDWVRRERDRLERETRDALVLCAAIIEKYGLTDPEHPDRRSVELEAADLERISADAPTVYREDRLGGGFRLSLRLSDG